MNELITEFGAVLTPEEIQAIYDHADRIVGCSTDGVIHNYHGRVMAKARELCRDAVAEQGAR